MIVHVCGDDGDGDTWATILDNLANVLVLNANNILAINLNMVKVALESAHLNPQYFKPSDLQ